jgi:hypothetical protein
MILRYVEIAAFLILYNVAITLLTQAEARNRALVAAVISAPLAVLSYGLVDIVLAALHHASTLTEALVYTDVAASTGVGTFLGARLGANLLRGSAEFLRLTPPK